MLRPISHEPVEMTMRSSEWIALAYFVYLAVMAVRAPVAVSRRRRVIAVAAIVAFAILVLSRAPADAVTLVARDWLPLLYMLVGYWLPALLVGTPDLRFERVLADLDRRWLRFRGLESQVFMEFVELSYLFCYPLVPIGFSCLYLAGLRGEADRFWTAVLLAVFPCYGLLPWLPTRPPRVLEGAGAGASAIRRLNLRVLDRASVQLNTFPSGHVASAIATALVVAAALPAAGLLLAVIAGGIAVGSVVGRYHYLADVLAGVVLALAAFWVSRAIS